MADALIGFKWVGLDKQGKRVRGVLESLDLKTAAEELKKRGIDVIDLQKKQTSQGMQFRPFNRKNKITPNDVLLFTRYLSTMIAAGLPIMQALDIISQDQENPAMQSLILSIRGNISGGKTLAESFSQFKDQFSELYCSLIRAGEKSGTIDQILARLANYLERTEKLKKKLKKALIYPAAILSIAGIVSVILLVFVVPQFDAMFKSFGADLPVFTRMVVNLSDFLRSYWWLVLLLIGLSVSILRYYLTQNEMIIELIDKWLLRVYLIGPLLKKGTIARYTRTLATTLDAGMPIVESMKSMENVMGNRLYSRAVKQIRDDVVAGNQLSKSMAKTSLFPNMAIQMIAVGEASGSLAAMLNKVADYYEEEVNNTVDNLSTLLEPVIMAVLGVIIGGFVVAMYLPIFRLGSLF